MKNFSEKFVDGFLKLHNQYRAIHTSPPVAIVEELNESAQEWADILAKRGTLAYRSDPNYGENVYVSFWRDVPEDIKPRDPIEFWYQEGKYFKYGEPTVKNLEDVRHFTQLVWKGSTSIGLGMATGYDGKIYLVCNYQPPGNVDGEFAENVLPMEEADEELLEHEAEAIRTLEIQAKVVRSMERLYAVPSEKLRVWSIWLAKIGEIADQWQRWLRARIDLVLRIAEHLEVAEDAIRRDEEKGDKPSKVSSRSEQLAAEVVDSPEKTPDDGQEPSQETVREVTDSSSVYVSAIGVGDEMDDDKNARAKPTESEVTLTQEEKEALMTWPIGMPWQHLGEKVEIETEEIEKLPMPRNEEEMRAFFKEFTHEATVYRSYYKHWRETADQATKVMGGRFVMATFVVQGKGKRVEEKVPVKRRPRPKKTAKRRSPVKKASRKAKKPKGPAKDGESPNDDEESMTQPAEAQEETPQDEAPAEDSVEAENDEDLVTPVPSETPTVIEVAPEPLESNTEEGPSNGTKESIVAKPNDEWQEVSELVKDCARAAEPIPYFFYLKAEPDIEIALEHDDEVVIPADTDRENIVGNYKRVWFNLAEKPLKGGKPYI